ncbi:UNVERIFIED_CONTAM: hypothetical protein MT382_21665 [Aeromonas salmonicida]
MTIKQFVHEVHVQFKQFELDTPLKRSHVYELIAATFGYNTYASLQSDAILLSNTGWQPVLDVSAIERRARELGMLFPELLVQKLIAMLGQFGVISLKVKEILRSRFNDDYITQFLLNNNAFDFEASALNRFSPTDSFSGELMNLLQSREHNSALVLESWKQLSNFADRNSENYADHDIHKKLYEMFGDFTASDSSTLSAADKERYFYWQHHLKASARGFDINALYSLAIHNLDSSFYINSMPRGIKNDDSIALKCEGAGLKEHAYYWWVMGALNGSVIAMHKLINSYEGDNLHRCWLWIFLAKELGFDLLEPIDTSVKYEVDLDNEIKTIIRPGIILPALKLTSPDGSLLDDARKLAEKLYQKNFIDDDIMFDEYGNYDSD